MALAGAAVLALLPSGDTIRGSGFYVFGRLTLASFMDVAGSIAGPLAVVALVLLLATGVLALVGRRDGLTRAVCVVQPAVGVVALGGSGLGWAVLLVVAIVNLVFWIVAVVAITVLCIALLVGFFMAALEG